MSQARQDRARERKLENAERSLERALTIVRELGWNANGINDVGKANVWGILVLKKLGVIQLIEEDGRTLAIVNE